jgi:hypothetical protein
MDGGTVQDIVGSLPVAIILIAGLCAPIAGWLAMQRSRNPALWFVFGALTGPVALMLLLAAPVGRCPRCETRASGWSGVCAACGTRLGGIFDEDEPVRVPDSPVSVAPVVLAQPGSGPVDPPAFEAGTSGTPSFAPPANAPSAGAAAAGAAAADAAAAGPVAAGAASMAQLGSPPPGFGPAATLRARAPSTTPRSETTNRVSAVDASGGEVLATAVYMSGNAGLEIGACYAIARVEDRIRVFGPVDTGQLTIRHERPMADGEVVALDDRLLITLRHGRSATSMIMRWIGGMAPAAVEAALSPSASEGRPTAELRP